MGGVFADRAWLSRKGGSNAALLFLYDPVLGKPLEGDQPFVRAKRPERLPVVLSAAEVARVLEQLEGVAALMAELLYGSGLRLLECARLRVKGVSFDRGELTVGGQREQGSERRAR